MLLKLAKTLHNNIMIIRIAASCLLYYGIMGYIIVIIISIARTTQLQGLESQKFKDRSPKPRVDKAIPYHERN